jgi:hypothetical protein
MAVSSEAHAMLYDRLRTSLLTRHFALGSRNRANLFSLWNTLSTDLSADDLAAAAPGDQLLARWSVTGHGRENPLMMGGLLNICLAVESHLGIGDPAAVRIAVASLRMQYKFSGAFTGYPVRWDAATSDNWSEFAGVKGAPAVCRQFLLTPGGRYSYSPSSSDPRWAPFRAWEQARTPLERQRRQFEHDEFFDWYRRTEPSMDELCGLMAGYFMMERLAADTATRRDAKVQAERVGSYLANHGYLIVRPGDGFSARGASGVLPAFEYPFVRGLEAMTGIALWSQADFRDACEAAGVWSHLVGPITAAEIGAIAALPVVSAIPIVGPMAVLAATLGLFGLGGLLGATSPLTPLQVARAAAVIGNKAVFDVSTDAEAGEFAAALLLHEIKPRQRFELWLKGASSIGGGYAQGFPPFLGLLGWKTSATVTAAYRSWLAARVAGGKDPDGEYSRSCFASAVAVLCGAGPGEEARLVGLLEERQGALTAAGAGAPAAADLSLHDDVEQGKTVELYSRELDYCCALVLAWLHADEMQNAGTPVGTADFPRLPPAFRPEIATVPHAVAHAAFTGDAPMIPYTAIRPDEQPPSAGGEPLFPATGVPARPASLRTALPVPSRHLLYDEQVTVPKSAWDVLTAVVLREGDVFEITATGTINAGMFAAGDNGPNGWDGVVSDRSFPLHDLIDPINAHPYALLGRLNNYFFVGSARPRQRWLFHRESALMLRINDNQPGNGTGAFQVRVRVWGEPAPCDSLRVIAWAARDASDPDRSIDRIGGMNRDGSPWQATLKEVVDALQDQENRNKPRYVIRSAAGACREVVVGQRRRHSYLRTVPNRFVKDNLGALPGPPS